MYTFIDELSEEERVALEEYEKAKRGFIFCELVFPVMLFGPIYIVTRWQMVSHELPWIIIKFAVTRFR